VIHPLSTETNGLKGRGLERCLNHFLPQVCLGQVDIFEGGFLLLMPHELLKRRNSHVLIGFVRAEGMPESMRTAPPALRYPC
jgi:hypothetical protein